MRDVESDAVFRYLSLLLWHFIRPPGWINNWRFHRRFYIADWLTNKSWILTQKCHISRVGFVLSRTKVKGTAFATVDFRREGL